MKLKAVFMHKERNYEISNTVDNMMIVGNPEYIQNKTAIILDDMCDTAGTLCKAADKLREAGAKEVYAFISHGLLNGPAAERIAKSALKKVIITDSINLPEKTKEILGDKIVQVPLDLYISELIRRSHLGEHT